MRGSDIFENSDPEYAPDYAQPPLCFYQQILHNFKFKNIHIISSDNYNPLIKYLLKQFKNIKFNKHSLDIDFSYLANSFNLVGSVSSFSLISIRFNNNLKNYYEYDIYRLSEKFMHFHYDYFEFPRNFTIYRMKPSEKYKNEMFKWENKKEQINLMIEEKCKYNFTII